MTTPSCTVTILLTVALGLTAAACGSTDNDAATATSPETVALQFLGSKTCAEIEDIITKVEDIAHDCESLENDYLNASDCSLVESEALGAPGSQETRQLLEFECTNNNKDDLPREPYGVYLVEVDGTWKVENANS